MNDIENLLSAASLRLTRERPYLGAALWAVRRVMTTATPTMAVDKYWRLYYNPETVGNWTAEETAGVLYHELCHLLRDHAGRGTFAEDATAWNYACDAEINDDLREEGVALPGSPIFPATLQQEDGKLAEEYYTALPVKEIPKDAVFQVGAGGCGSCATGVSGAWEMGAGGEVPSLRDGEIALIVRSVAVAVREWAAQNPGTTPGHWKRWADERLAPPKVDWRKEMASAVRRALADSMGATDYRYNRPSRRQSVGNGIIFPALRQPVPSVAVVVDTSGSMNDALLSAALSEISGILKSSGQRQGVNVLSVDTQVHHCQRVFRAEQVRPAGGGGTDMGAGLHAAASLRPRPDIAIVLTDGFTPWPDASPGGIRTLVGILGNGGTAPAWAQRINIEMEAQ